MQFSQSSRVNQFLGGSSSSSSNSSNSSSNSNAFINKTAATATTTATTAATTAATKEENVNVKAAVEDFPALTKKAITAATAATATAASYKDLLVSTIDRRMVEEQSKMRSAQAAELERGGEYYSKVLLSDARAARAAANAGAETDLEYLYDEDGCERR